MRGARIELTHGVLDQQAGAYTWSAGPASRRPGIQPTVHKHRNGGESENVRS